MQDGLCISYGFICNACNCWLIEYVYTGDGNKYMILKRPQQLIIELTTYILNNQFLVLCK